MRNRFYPGYTKILHQSLVAGKKMTLALSIFKIQKGIIHSDVVQDQNNNKGKADETKNIGFTQFKCDTPYPWWQVDDTFTGKTILTTSDNSRDHLLILRNYT